MRDIEDDGFVTTHGLNDYVDRRRLHVDPRELARRELIEEQQDEIALLRFCLAVVSLLFVVAALMALLGVPA